MPLSGTSVLRRQVPGQVRAIQAVFLFEGAVVALWSIVGWSWLANPSRYAGVPKWFTTLGSISVGTRLTLVAMTAVTLVALATLSVVAGRPNKWAAYGVGAAGAIQLLGSPVPGVLLLVLVTTGSARRFYWRRDEAIARTG